MIKNTLSTCCFVALASGLTAGEVVTPKNPIQPPVAATSTGDFFLGGNVREDSWYSYAGFNYALNGDINSTGWLLHGVAGYGEYEYSNGGQSISDSDSDIDGEVKEYDLGIGYQWVTESYRLSLVGAANYQDHDLDGFDPNNSVQGDEWGFKAKADIWFYGSPNWLYGGTFTYSTAFDSYWNRVVFAKKLGNLHVGPEFIFQGNEEYDEIRLGLTLGGVKLGPATIGVSAGYAWAEPQSGSDDQESIYGSIHASFSF